MTSSSRFRQLLGLLLLFASLAFTYGAWYSANGALETLAWAEAHRTPADSVLYSSAVYHGSHARATQDNRWKPTGYATLGLAGTIIGIGLIASSRLRPAS